MPLETGLPFVRKVDKFVERGELDQCETWLRRYLARRPQTVMHCVLDVDFQRFLPDYSDWLLTATSKLKRLDPTIVICASMGEFEINYQDWHAHASVYENYDDPTDPYHWLCESDSEGIADWFHFTGLDELAASFEYSDEYIPGKEESPIDSETFTATCYLMFTYFLKLNRDTHELAKKRRRRLRKAHLFCDYGDCLYYSPPTGE